MSCLFKAIQSFTRFSVFVDHSASESAKLPIGKKCHKLVKKMEEVDFRQCFNNSIILCGTTSAGMAEVSSDISAVLYGLQRTENPQRTGPLNVAQKPDNGAVPFF